MSESPVTLHECKFPNGDTYIDAFIANRKRALLLPKDGGFATSYYKNAKVHATPELAVRKELAESIARQKRALAEDISTLAALDAWLKEQP